MCIVAKRESILIGETIKDGDFPILLGMISQVTMKPKATST
jgi:hypothetical protein